MRVLGAVIRENRLLLGLIAAHLALTVLLGRWLGTPFRSDVVAQLGGLFLVFVPISLLILLIWRVGGLARRVRPIADIAPMVTADLRALARDGERLAQGVILLVALTLFGTAVVFIKAAIPQILPFTWDPALAGLDRILHGGTDPYVYLMPLINSGWAMAVIDLAYNGWIVLMYFCLFTAAFARGDGGAGRVYLLAYALAWVLGGNLLAVAFSSVGPVYYAALGLGDTFAPLMNALARIDAETPLLALKVQGMLWSGYLSGQNIGISAMPSMHLATTTLMACYAFRHSRTLGWAMAGFLALILVGSVALGWHYAVDSYAGIALALLCWRLAVMALRRSDRDALAGAQPAGVPAE